MEPDSRWLTGPSLDGKGEFSYVEAPRLGQEPELMAGPPSAHGGVEATRPAEGDGAASRVVKKVKDAVT
jgi:Mn-containing catalase